MTSEEYAKYFYQKTLSLEKEILSLNKEISDYHQINASINDNMKFCQGEVERYRNKYYELKNNFDKEVEKEVANKIKIKERTFKANETKLKKEIDYLKKRVNALLLDIEALRR